LGRRISAKSRTWCGAANAVARAADKLASAQAESADAEAAYQLVLAARADWIANGPDAQLLML
jgi:hypothetical protein